MRFVNPRRASVILILASQERANLVFALASDAG